MSEDEDTVAVLLSPGGWLTDDGWLTEDEDAPVRVCGPFRFERSVFGYGWRLWVGDRVRFNSLGATSRRWPHIVWNGADEFCNRVIMLCCWPLGAPGPVGWSGATDSSGRAVRRVPE